MEQNCIYVLSAYYKHMAHYIITFFFINRVIEYLKEMVKVEIVEF